MYHPELTGEALRLAVFVNVSTLHPPRSKTTHRSLDLPHLERHLSLCHPQIQLLCPLLQPISLCIFLTHIARVHMLPDLWHLPHTVEISIKATLHALEAGALLCWKSHVEGTLHVFPILLQVHPVVPDETHFLLCVHLTRLPLL